MRIPAGCFAAAFLLAAATPTPSTAQAQDLDTAMLGTHPWAAKQPTAWGKEIVCLYPWHGKLYAGYGDWTANTGPIVIAPFDPVARSFDSEFTANTEAIVNYREIFGRLFAPAIDRRLYSEPGDYFAMDSAYQWHAYNAGSTTHAFDMVTLTDTDLWIVGSQDVNAIAFRSTDSGKNWPHAKLTDPMSAVYRPGDSAFGVRFYCGAVYHGKLYALPNLMLMIDSTRMAEVTCHSLVFDGTSWKSGPDLLGGDSIVEGWRPVVFHNTLVFLRHEPFGTVKSYGGPVALRLYDDSAGGRKAGVYCTDFTTSGDTLFALVYQLGASGGDRYLQRTEDLVHWTTLGRAPPSAISLARMDGHFYVGTSDSRIMEVSVPPEPPQAVPSAPLVDEGLDVFPNPATGSITVTTDFVGARRVEMIDLLGWTVSTSAVTGSSTVLDVSHLAPGLYLVRVLGSERALERMVMVE